MVFLKASVAEKCVVPISTDTWDDPFAQKKLDFRCCLRKRDIH